MDNLLGKVSIVTGGAMGIGREIALRLARDGSDVAIVDMEKEPAQEVVKEIRSLGRFGKPSEVDALVRFLVSDECSFSTGQCYDISGGRAVY